MNLTRCSLAALATVTLFACQSEAPQEAAYDPTHDYYSFANTDAYRTEHLVLDLDVNFEARSLEGTATLALRTLKIGEPTIILDTRDMVIEGARVGLEGGERQSAAYALGETDPLLGQPLVVTLPDGFDPQGGFELEIDYRTTPGASALQWLPPELTAGGEHPLMFSQSQAIHARSWVPLQDTPAVRILMDDDKAPKSGPDE